MHWCDRHISLLWHLSPINNNLAACKPSLGRKLLAPPAASIPSYNSPATWKTLPRPLTLPVIPAPLLLGSMSISIIFPSGPTVWLEPLNPKSCVTIVGDCYSDPSLACWDGVATVTSSYRHLPIQTQPWVSAYQPPVVLIDTNKGCWEALVTSVTLASCAIRSGIHGTGDRE